MRPRQRLMDALARDGRFEMAEDEVALMSALFDAARVDEAQTQETMRDVLKRFDMQIDPHTAVGLAAARRAVLPDGVPMVTLATAHPASFPLPWKPPSAPAPIFLRACAK